jgi:hypothetical protein
MEDGTDFSGKAHGPLVGLGAQIVSVVFKRLALLWTSAAKEALGPDGQDKGHYNDDQKTAKKPLVVFEKEILKRGNHKIDAVIKPAMLGVEYPLSRLSGDSYSARQVGFEI